MFLIKVDDDNQGQPRGTARLMAAIGAHPGEGMRGKRRVWGDWQRAELRGTWGLDEDIFIALNSMGSHWKVLEEVARWSDWHTAIILTSTGARIRQEWSPNS